MTQWPHRAWINLFPFSRDKNRSVAAATPIMGVVLGLVLLIAGSHRSFAETTSITRAGAGTSPAVNLERASFSSLPGNKVQILLTLSGNSPRPLTFTTDNPARLVMDLPGVSNQLPSNTQNIGVGMARTLSAVQAQGRTRVVVNLVQLVPYETRVAGNSIYITLEGSRGAPARMAREARVREVGRETAGGGHVINNIDFRRSPGGSGQVIVTFSEAPPTLDVREEGGKIVVDFPNTRLPERLERRLDVVDFATPVDDVDAVMRAQGVRMTISAHGDYEHFAYQTDKTFTLEVRPLTREQVEAAKKKYTGEKLSLNFQDIEVRAVLQLLADFTGLNIVTSDSVTGSITLRLKDVPWDQALDIVLQTKGLGKRQQGNVIWVAPLGEIAAREKQELQALKEREQLAPLRSEFIQVNYAKASDLANLLKAKENSLLSERGAVTVDERTNTLLVQDTSDKLAEIRGLVARLDVPVRQVMIDSRVVIANKNFARDLGVRFGVTDVRARDNRVIATGGSLEGTNGIINTLPNNAVTNIRNTGQPFPVDLPALGDRLNVNLPAAPAAGVAGKIALSILSANNLLDLELSALQAEGKGEVLSNPRVITSDQQEAVIKQGREIPYQQATASGATSVSFKEVTLTLRVVPHITPDDRVRMDLTVTKDDVGANVNVISSNGQIGSIPSIDKREVKTQVLVNNGDTVVLGGVFEQTRNNNRTKIPFLGDIPLLGDLFKQTHVDDTKTELLLFVTPKIIKESLKLE
jgi:type IV pilus assembly protein PilQ